MKDNAGRAIVQGVENNKLFGTKEKVIKYLAKNKVYINPDPLAIENARGFNLRDVADIEKPYERRCIVLLYWDKELLDRMVACTVNNKKKLSLLGFRYRGQKA